jgi:hypothetical protein
VVLIHSGRSTRALFEAITTINAEAAEARREQTLDAALRAFELSTIVSACSAVSALIVVVRGTDSR